MVRPDFRTGLIVLVVPAVVGAGIAAILIGDAPVVFALDVGGPFVVLLPLGCPRP